MEQVGHVDDWIWRLESGIAGVLALMLECSLWRVTALLCIALKHIR